MTFECAAICVHPFLSVSICVQNFFQEQASSGIASDIQSEERFLIQMNADKKKMNTDSEGKDSLNGLAQP